MPQSKCPRCGFAISVTAEALRIRCPQCFEELNVVRGQVFRAAAPSAAPRPPNGPASANPPPLSGTGAKPPAPVAVLPTTVPITPIPVMTTPEALGVPAYPARVRPRARKSQLFFMALVTVLMVGLAGVLTAALLHVLKQPGGGILLSNPLDRLRTPRGSEVGSTTRQEPPRPTDNAAAPPRDRQASEAIALFKEGRWEINAHDPRRIRLLAEFTFRDDKVVEEGEVVVAFRDSSDNPLGQGTVEVFWFGPASTVRFTMEGGLSAAAPDTMRIFPKLQVKKAASPGTVMLEVGSVKFVPNGAGDNIHRVTGVVRNPTAAATEENRVHIELYENNGRLAKRDDRSLARSGPLGPGQEQEFSFDIPAELVLNIGVVADVRAAGKSRSGPGGP